MGWSGVMWDGLGGVGWGGAGHGGWGRAGCDNNIVAVLTKGEVEISKMIARGPH